MSERWKPEEGERYYFIDSCIDVDYERHDGHRWEEERFAAGNCFNTEAEAQAAVEKVKALLLSLHDNGKNLQSDLPNKQLPGWCKVGEWVFIDPENVFGHTGYKKIQAIDGLGLVFADGSCICFSDKIKQTRLRPYNADEMRALVGKIVEESPCGYGINYLLVTAYHSGVDYDEPPAVLLLDEWVTADDLRPDVYSIGGHPCGVLEHIDNGEWVE